MKLKISDLKTMGAFVPSEIVRKEVKIKRPKPKPAEEWAVKNVPEFTDEFMEDTLTVFIRKGMAADRLEILQASNRDRAFIAILRAVCNEDGTPMFSSLDQIMGGEPDENGEPTPALADWLVFPLFKAITEVAGDGPKASRRARNGGSKPASPTASQ